MVRVEVGLVILCPKINQFVTCRRHQAFLLIAASPTLARQWGSIAVSWGDSGADSTVLVIFILVHADGFRHSLVISKLIAQLSVALRRVVYETRHGTSKASCLHGIFISNTTIECNEYWLIIFSFLYSPCS